LDYAALKQDLVALMTDSQDWWPADWGHYGGLFMRMAWHSAGTYRTADGRGGAGTGNQRFAPVNSWPDNGNLDKARRLLWPIKQQVRQRPFLGRPDDPGGQRGDRVDGLQDLWLWRGREDIWAARRRHLLGCRDRMAGHQRARQRYSGERELENPLAAVQMGLIYVNPEGPNGKPDPVASGRDVRETFARMAMNDDETVALVAGGHTFGKAHGAGDPKLVGPEPEAAPHANPGPGLDQPRLGSGKGGDTTTSGIEGAWKPNPTTWDMGYFKTCCSSYEWELLKQSRRRAAVGGERGGRGRPDPRRARPDEEAPPDDDDRRPVAALRPGLRKDLASFPGEPRRICRCLCPRLVQADPPGHGPKARYLGPEVPAEDLVWQDPLPAVDHPLIDAGDITLLKAKVLASGLSVPELVSTAWASASTFRGSDKRGGANGARIRLAPQKDWAVNQPAQLARVLAVLVGVRSAFNAAQTGGKQVSLADLIVLAGNAGVESAAAAAGHVVEVPFTPGRTDATEAQTDVASFAVLEPQADGFRNWRRSALRVAPEEMLLDRAQLLTLSAPEMTVGGRPARAGRQRGRCARGCLHRPARAAQQRLLRESGGHGHRLDAGGCKTPTKAATAAAVR
jgi:catalase-peroxidase